MGLGRWEGMELLGRWRVQSWVSLPLEAANWGGLMGPPQPRSSRALHERGNPIRAGELPAPEPRGGDMGHKGVPQAACLCLGGMSPYGKEPSCPGLVVTAVWGLSPWWSPGWGGAADHAAPGVQLQLPDTDLGWRRHFWAQHPLGRDRVGSSPQRAHHQSLWPQVRSGISPSAC